MFKFLFLFFLPISIFANEFAYKLSYFEDKNNSNFQEAKTKTYIDMKNNYMNKGYNPNTFWIKVEIQNNLDKNIRKILSVDKSNTDFINFYDDTNLLVETGTHRNSANKEIYDIAFAFYVGVLANSKKTYYLKMNIKGSFSVAFSMEDEKVFLKKSKLKEFSLLFFFGFMVSIMLYNLFLLLTLRESIYIYYVLFQFVTLLLLLYRSGLGIYIVWVDDFVFNDFVFTYIAQLEIIFGFLFIRAFFNLKDNFPKLNIASLIGISSSILVNVDHIYFIHTLVLVSNLSLGLFIIFYSVYKNVVGARIFLLALFSFIVGAFFSALLDAGLVESNFFIKYSMLIGSMIEATIFSIALAQKIDILKTQKEEALHISKKKLSEQVKQKTKKISTLLDNASQGFLTLNDKFLIDEEYSQKCEDILGNDITNKSISSVLFKDANQFETDLKDILEIENQFAKQSLITLLPQEITINNKILEIEYKILDNNKFMLIITDVSENKMLESQIKKKQKTLQMIVSIVSNTGLFFDVKNSFEYLASNASLSIKTDKEFSQNINEIYSSIHTFKGSFSQLYMNETVDFLHDVESQLADFKKNNITNDRLMDFIDGIDFKSFMKNDLKSVNNLLGKDFLLQEHFILVDKNSIRKIKEKALLIKNTYKNDTDVEDVFKSIRNLLKYNLKNMLKQYVGLSMQLANKLDKEIYEFEIKGDNHIFIFDKYKPFIKSLVHIFRNMIDHGIELPSTREHKGKIKRGNISCSFKIQNQDLQIIISDDGSGINTQKIKEKISNDSSKQIDISSLSDEEIHKYIFKSGFSTLDKVTKLSGRGVGLSAVNEEINKLNGNIKIQSEINIGTTFVFTIPMYFD